MRVVRDGLLFCPCCTLMACNGDTCDCGDDPRNHPAGLVGAVGDCTHLVPDFDSESGRGIEDFTWRGCDGCGSHLGGSRHAFAILGEDDHASR